MTGLVAWERGSGETGRGETRDIVRRQRRATVDRVLSLCWALGLGEKCN
jgi:hypothetical protein